MEQRGLRVISEYFEELASKPTKDTLYRGHADADWTLTPSVYRPGARGIDCYDKLNWWSREAARFVSPVPHQPIEWLVLAQHFGVPTPMLDWTSSPLVGLYFACDGEADKPGCVWQVRTPSAFIPFYHMHTIDVFRRDRTKPGLIYATAMNARTLAQDSAMSLHGPNDSVEPQLMRKVYTVQPEAKEDTLRALAVLGFTKERLFSDLSVLVARFREELDGHPTRGRRRDVPEKPARLNLTLCLRRRVGGSMDGEPEQEALFELQGPDEDGCVWACSPEGRAVWCQNLGPAAKVAEVMSQWLASIDQDENF